MSGLKDSELDEKIVVLAQWGMEDKMGVVKLGHKSR
jgi:hypothetical protein